MVDTEKTSYIFTDSEKTRSVIWDKYLSFINHYERFFQMNLTTNGRYYKEDYAGIIRYAISFYDEVRNFIETFISEHQLSSKEVNRYHNLFTYENLKNNKFNEEDLFFIRRIMTDFMTYSGIRKIIYEKSQEVL